MRICALAFANLNSLAGEWRLDFEDAAFDDGLFLIAGDTGAGKTTILDALSLALYGKTVRQGSLSATSNEVMTRGESEAWAEATFETDQGRFLARWAQHRARGRADGALQAIERALTDLRTGKSLGEHRASETGRLIEKTVGLTFGQFQRTLMLAQGQFDRFLSAKESERADILQQTTGTEVFAHAGKAIFERLAQAKAARQELAGKLGALTVLTDAERQAIEAERDAHRDAQTQAEAAAKALRDRLAAFDAAAQKAREAQDALARRGQVRKEAADEAAKAGEALQAAARNADVARQAREKTAPTIAQALALETQIAQAEPDRAAKAKAAARAERDLAKARAERDRLAAAVAKDRALAEAIAAALDGRAGPFPDGAGEDAEAAERFLALRGRVAQAERARAELNDRAEKARAKAKEAEKTFDVVRPALLAARDNAEAAFRLACQIASLEERRRELEAGRPCPLCGATEHPYADGALPSRSETQRAYDEAKKALDDAQGLRDAARRQMDDAVDRLREADAAGKRDRDTLDTLRTQLSAAATAAQARAETNQAAHAGCVADLGTLKEDADKAKAQADAADADLAGLRDRLAALGLPAAPAAFRDTLQEACEAAAKRLADAQTAQAAALTAQQNADAEWRAAEAEAKAAEQALRDAREALGGEPDALRDALAQREDEAKARAADVGADEERLRQDGANRARRTRHEADLARAEENLRLWGNLNRWLGGENGDAFKRYAQGITLRHLLRHANPHLLAMSQGRYELAWAPGAQEALLPFVVDHDQADGRRPVSNLSGGERFQVSLALALGLSGMSGAKVRVDSLFLDEGFGTLDGKALEAAIDTLCRLRRDGTRIGIISHVAELAERIPAQIRVSKCGGGRSVLSGPGVSRGRPAVRV